MGDQSQVDALIARGQITCDDIKDLRLNSDQWESLIPHYSDEAFIARFKYCLQNCNQEDRSTYDSAMVHRYGPELLKRFERGWTYKIQASSTYGTKRATTKEEFQGSRIEASGECKEIDFNSAYPMHAFCNRCGSVGSVLHMQGAQCIGCDACRTVLARRPK